jgi:hypothetical protein
MSLENFILGITAELRTAYQCRTLYVIYHHRTYTACITNAAYHFQNLYHVLPLNVMSYVIKELYTLCVCVFTTYLMRSYGHFRLTI